MKSHVDFLWLADCVYVNTLCHDAACGASEIKKMSLPFQMWTEA